MTSAAEPQPAGSPAASPADGPSPCTVDDLADLERFQLRMYGAGARQLEAGRTRWLFADNPCRDGEALCLWIFRRFGEIVAARGSIPFVLQVGDEGVSASWSVDVVADPQVRGTGVADELSRSARRPFRVVCGLDLSEAGYRFALRQGFTDLGMMPLQFWLADWRTFDRCFPTSRRLTRSVRPLARFLTAVTWSACRVRALGTRLEAVDRFDRRVDDVWSDASAAYPVVARRDATWLGWRFDAHPRRDEYRRFYLTRRARVVGYVVIRSSAWNGLPAVEVVDYLAAPRSLAALFAGVAAVGRREGVAAVLCSTLNRRGRTAFRSLGFVRRWSGTRFLAAVGAGDPVAPSVTDARQWFLTAADSDVD